MIYEVYSVGGEIYHHGILGQKWGKRNGPPYPLHASAHSVAEKKIGYKKSLGGGRNESLYKRNIKKKKMDINKQGSIKITKNRNTDDFNTKRDSNGIYYSRAKTRKQIDSIPGNTLTIEGVNIEKDSDRLMFKNFLERKGINTKDLNIITVLGSDMNKAYNLTGNNAYQDNFHIQAFDGLNTKDPNVSVTLRSMGCRWMEDIIDNNVAREKHKR